MKKIKYFLIGTLLISIISFSCKKDSSSKPTTVEYKISNYDAVYVEKIVYTGSNGSDVVVDDPTKWGSGDSTSIIVTSKPFNAKITVQVTNQFAGSYDFSLSILVDGKVMTTVEGSAPPNNSATYTASAEYTVQ